MNILFYLNRGWTRYVGSSPFYTLACGAEDNPDCTVIWAEDFSVMPPEVATCDVLVTDMDPTVSGWFPKVREGVVKVCLDGDMHRFTKEECDLYRSLIPRYDIVLSQYVFSTPLDWVFTPTKEERKSFVFFPHMVPDMPRQRGPRELGGVQSGLNNSRSYPFRTWLNLLNLPFDTILEHPGYSDPSAMIEARESFCGILDRHKVSVTGLALGENGYTVAKYFEIPYAGCLLVAEEPCSVDREVLGFRSGKNCFLFRQGDVGLRDLYIDVLANWDRYLPVAEAGCRLVMAKHTVRHRLIYLKAIVNHFRDNGAIPQVSEQIHLFGDATG